MKIQTTKDYSQFHYDPTNRGLGDIRRLKASMQANGFLSAHPLHCVKNGKGYVVIDGQHRLEAARELGIPVWFLVCDGGDKLNIAQINLAQRPWSIKDFCTSYYNQDNEHFAFLLSFAETHSLPLTVCASLLTGQQAASGNVYARLKDGTFVVRGIKFAERVAELVVAIRQHVNFATNKLLVNALSMCVFVPAFSSEQFVHKVSKFPHLLTLKPTSDEFLKMLEAVYNHQSRTPIPLYFTAKEAAKKRSAVPSTKKPAHS